MFISFVFIVLVALVAQNEAISSNGGIFGKKRTKVLNVMSFGFNSLLLGLREIYKMSTHEIRSWPTGRLASEVVKFDSVDKRGKHVGPFNFVGHGRSVLPDFGLNSISSNIVDQISNNVGPKLDPGLATNSLNRFLCPDCHEKLKKALDNEAIEENEKLRRENLDTIENVRIHCIKGDKGDKGDIGIPGELGLQGPKGTCDQEQIEEVVKPMKTKLEALLSSYTTEIARLRNEVYSIKSKFVRTIGSPENPAKSCKEIYEQERYSPSGPYYLNITGRLTRVYCFMEEDETCPAGSTLVLKIDGTKDTFKYSSPLWTNKEVYAEENGFTLFDTKETKLSSFWSVPFTKICINMRKLDSLEVKSLIIYESSTSLFDLLADGKYRATEGGLEIWESLLPGSQVQRGCYLEGFNVHGTQDGSAGARIGVIASDQSNCTSPDSFIGFGTEGGSCDSSRKISCGNELGTCNTDADKYIPAFGYIFVY